MNEFFASDSTLLNNQELEMYYDAFISSPMASVSSSEYDNLRTFSLELISCLKQYSSLSTYYYAGKNIMHTQNFEANNEALNTDLNALRDSKYFIMVYPYSIVSSVLVEAAWAILLEKPSIFFVINRSDLPYLLRNAEKASKEGLVKIIEVASIDHIMDVIREKGDKLFQN